MSYKKITGDLLELFDKGKFDIIIHGCNCFHTMGAGIAGQITKKYKSVYLTDKLESKKGDITKLSNYTVCCIPQGVIINLYTQYEPGANFDINALKLGMKKIAHRIKGDTHLKIGIPMIGAGIGGGNWSEIEPIIKEALKEFDVTLVEYNKK